MDDLCRARSRTTFTVVFEDPLSKMRLPIGLYQLVIEDPVEVGPVLTTKKEHRKHTSHIVAVKGLSLPWNRSRPRANKKALLAFWMLIVVHCHPTGQVQHFDQISDCMVLYTLTGAKIVEGIAFI